DGDHFWCDKLIWRIVRIGHFLELKLGEASMLSKAPVVSLHLPQIRQHELERSLDHVNRGQACVCEILPQLFRLSPLLRGNIGCVLDEPLDEIRSPLSVRRRRVVQKVQIELLLSIRQSFAHLLYEVGYD